MKRGAFFCIVMLSVLTCPAWAEDPVYFADAKLKAAVVAKLGVTDPTPSDMLDLIVLNAVGEGITNLTGLESAANLALLNVQDNEIASVSVLSGLVNLGQIILSNNDVTDLSPLSGLTSLRLLTVRHNGITSVPTLTGLPSLLRLELSHNEIHSVESLSDLTSLTLLELSLNNLENISFLDTVSPGITALRMSVNRYSDVSPVTRFSNLEVCEVHWNPLDEDAYCTDLHTIYNNNPGVALYYDANPGPVAGVSASNGTHPDKITVTWESLCGGPSKTVFYRVYRSLSSDGDKQCVADPQTATSFEDTDVEAGRVYYYHIQSARWSSPQIGSDYPYSAAVSGYAGTLQSHLAISSTNGGSVTMPGEGSFAYDNGAVVTISATAEMDYEFTSWTGTAVSAGKVADAGAASTTVTVDDDYTLVANFQGGGHTLDVSATAGGWVITPGEGSYSYSHGQSVTLEAQAQAGYHFVGWSGSLCSSSSRVSIEMNSDHHVTANFAPDPQTLTISSGVGGSVVVPGEGVFSCGHGDRIRVVAVPDAGYGFAGWSGDLVEGGALADPNAVLVDCVLEADATLHASFLPALQTLYVDDDALGDPAPGDAAGSDPDEDGTWDHPFDTIQEGIEAADDGQAVLV